MSEPIEYGWREACFEMARGGLVARVEKWWCVEHEGDGNGWRWTGVDVSNRNVRTTLVSNQMSRTAAMDAAEAWIAEQIANAVDLSVYAFAGLEAEPARAERQAGPPKENP